MPGMQIWWSPRRSSGTRALAPSSVLAPLLLVLDLALAHQGPTGAFTI